MSQETPSEAFERILTSLDQILLSHGKASLVRSQLKFVMMDNFQVRAARGVAVDGSAESVLTAHVQVADLMNEEAFVKRLPNILQGGPSWIHANWQHTRAHGDIVDINVGAKVGNPLPSINVSFQPNPMELVVK